MKTKKNKLIILDERSFLSCIEKLAMNRCNVIIADFMAKTDRTDYTLTMVANTLPIRLTD